MNVERVSGATCGPPFPVYPDLADRLAGAHRREPAERDATVAHVLAACAGYAYADPDTVATMAARLGLEAGACVRVAQAVDAMFVFSTAYLVQSRCGRVVILCYRGTEPATLGNWLGDADVGSESSRLSAGGAEAPRVHAGFHRNLRATWWGVLEELSRALQARSLLDPLRSVDHAMESLYVAGHSLGGAMALLFALSVAGDPALRPIADRLRAVYTFGQPMAVGRPPPAWTDEVGRKLFRHVLPRDPVPRLPPAQWGPFAHLGQEFRLEGGAWRRADSPATQMKGMKEAAQSLLAFLSTPKRRQSFRYDLAQHGPHHYLDALRPRDRVSEFGD